MRRNSALIVALIAVGCGSGGGASDAAPLPADAAPADVASPLDGSTPDAGVCTPILGASAIEPQTLVLLADDATSVQVALPETYMALAVDPGSSDPILAAGAFGSADHVVFGFWASVRAVGFGVDDDMQAVDDAIAASLAGSGGEAHLIDSGAIITTHDAYAARVDREVRIYIDATRQVAWQRTLLLAQLLGVSAGVLGLPLPMDPYVGSLVIRYSVIRRSSEQTIVIAALAERGLYEDQHMSVGAAVRGIGGGSVVSRTGYVPRQRCATIDAPTRGRLDLITSDPGSPQPCNNAPYDCFFEKKTAFYAALFDALAASGLDARIASGAPPVNPMSDADPNQPLCPGDAFVDATAMNRQAFLECAAVDFEAAPLKNAEWMIDRLLPRAEAPNRLRPDAQAVAVLVGAWFLTDEPFSPSINFPPSPQQQGALDVYFLTRELPFRNEDVIVQSFVYLGDPSPPCPSVIRFGYPDVSTDLGGGAYDICFDDPAIVAQAIIETSVAAASPFLLAERPIVPSLSLVADTGVLQPTPADGFDYQGTAENSVIVRGIPRLPGHIATIGASYLVWEEVNPQ